MNTPAPRRDSFLGRPVGAARCRRAIAPALALALAAGCGAPRPTPQPPVFYPPAPEAPRIQFLCSLNSSADVTPTPGAFARFLLGDDRLRSATRLVRPYGLAFWEHRLYVCDSGSRQGVVFDFALRECRTFGREGLFRFGQPINISVGPDGEKYVTDTVRGQIVVFDRDDKPLRALGRPGELKPCDAVWHQGELYVADLKSNSIQVLDPQSGRVRRQIGASGSGLGQFAQPTNLAFGPDGLLYVSDTLNARVQVLEPSGQVVRSVGTLGRGLGQMVRPKGIAVDRQSRLYVCDAAAEVVQVFDAEGRLLMFLGGPGPGRGTLALPAKVAISYTGIEHFVGHAAPGFQIEYLLFVGNQLGPDKINVYGFGANKGGAPAAPAPAGPAGPPPVQVPR
ncbi:MAG TPA: hypothetical protein PLE19_16655 [Planctomycetota bacterium]|nr:hypothetical protein [Planctomycetota bacterium]HRR83203.1 hypothetical protein [Planctomycetota bacterium]HRT96196.1 hypothetical protein [Planctomycetota bacterium]